MRAIDGAGNSSEWSQEFIVTRDTTAPIVAITAGQWTNNTILPVVTVSGETQTVTHAWNVPSDIQASSLTTETPQFTAPATRSAQYELTLTVTDIAGNQITVPLRLTYNYTAPAKLPSAQPATTEPHPTQSSSDATQLAPATSAATPGSTAGAKAETNAARTRAATPPNSVASSSSQQLTYEEQKTTDASSNKQTTETPEQDSSKIAKNAWSDTTNTYEPQAVMGISTLNILGLRIF